MRTIDFSPLFRSSVGFDRLASLIDAAARTDGQSTYPPYNIELIGENKYRITMAVAGFKKTDIEILSEQDTLTVSGKQEQNKNTTYLYQGIAARSFERSFKLAEHVRVVRAEMQNGLLNIDLVREIPEAMKPRKIEIEQRSGDITRVKSD